MAEPTIKWDDLMGKSLSHMSCISSWFAGCEVAHMCMTADQIEQVCNQNPFRNKTNMHILHYDMVNIYMAFPDKCFFYRCNVQSTSSALLRLIWEWEREQDVTLMIWMIEPCFVQWQIKWCLSSSRLQPQRSREYQNAIFSSTVWLILLLLSC